MMLKISPSRLDKAHEHRMNYQHQRNRLCSAHTSNIPGRRFSQSIFSTPRLRLRPASTSSRYEPLACQIRRGCKNLTKPNRRSSLRLDHSSWTSSAPAASPSPPFSHTLRPSSSAQAARLCFANPPVARPDSQRAAHSEESRRQSTSGVKMGWL
jgi:hypothetical protein